MKNETSLKKKDLLRIMQVLASEIDLSKEVLADTGYSWKDACANLRLLRNDRNLELKVHRLWEREAKQKG